MEFLLGLNKEETRHKIARQKRLGRWFWALSIVALTIQVVITWRTSTREQVTAPASVEATAPAKVIALVETTSPPTLAVAYTGERVRETAQRVTPHPSLPTHSPDTPTPAPTPTVPIAGYVGQTRSGKLHSQETQPTPMMLFAPLMLLSPPDRVSEQTIRLAGTGQPNKTISVFLDHSLIAQTVVDDRGHWQTNVPTAPLIRGKNSLKVEAFGHTRVQGNGDGSSQSFSFTVTFDPWWLDAPIRLQASLGEGFACAPTVLGMAMDYYDNRGYHNQADDSQADARYPAPATTELVEALKRQGFISGYGADARMLCDLAIAYGYSHSFFYQEWSQAHLRQMLDAGHPVIANLRVNLGTSGYGHSVLVIGLSPDGKRVMFNDPAQGMVESPWAQFDRSWASFGPPYRHGTVIKP